MISTDLQLTSDIIEDFLRECNSYFIPNLNTITCIRSYSIKLSKFSRHFTIWQENSLIGLACCYDNDQKFECAYLSIICIDFRYQSKGLGMKLIETIINFYRIRKFKLIKLEVYKLNINAIKFYNKIGFRLLEEKEKSFILGFDLSSKD